MNKTVHCSRCKNPIDENVAFCPKCGNENKPKYKQKKKKNKLLSTVLILILVTSVALVGIYVIKNKDTQSLSNKQSNQITPALLPFTEDDKWGYMNTSGKVVVNPQYDWADEFSEGLAAVRVDDKYGFINEKGELVIQPEYDEVGNLDITGEYTEYKFKNGVVGAIKNNKYYMLDKNGDIVTKDYLTTSESSYKSFLNERSDASEFSEFAYDRYNTFSEGMSIYQDGDSGKYGYVDEEGIIAIKPQYDFAYEFSDGLAAVQKDGLIGFIDKEGKLVVDYQFDINKYTKFSEGLTTVNKDGKGGYIDKKGKFVIENKYEASGQFKEGLAHVKLAESQYREIDGASTEYIMELYTLDYIDKDGNTVLKDIDVPLYTGYIGFVDFNNGLLPAFKDGKVAYINKKGQPQSEYIFDYAEPFIGKVAEVIIGDKPLWINDKFQVIVPYQGVMEIADYIEYIRA